MKKGAAFFSENKSIYIVCQEKSTQDVGYIYLHQGNRILWGQDQLKGFALGTPRMSLRRRGETPLRPCSASGDLNRLRAASGGAPPGFVNPLFKRLSTECMGRRNPFRVHSKPGPQGQAFLLTPWKAFPAPRCRSCRASHRTPWPFPWRPRFLRKEDLSP